ncbi:MAG: hypothetical protein JWQ32_1521 [Marmoricola sp.]|nr:hypothetical protein [Marmoricola sp.]
MVVLCYALPLHESGVGLRAVVSFLVLQAFAFALPGMLAWRLIRGGRDPGIVDLVMGTIAFHALTVPWYLVVRWAGAPHLVWALPIATVAAVLGVGRTRGLRLASESRVPLWCAWNWAAAIAVGLTLIGAQLPVASGNRVRWQGTDNPFLLSLAAELKNHMPAQIPFVTGQHLDYHWFTFADIAATSWLGGQELDLLTFSLIPLGLLALGLAAFGALGWKFGGRPAIGVVALWLAVLVGSVNALGGFNGYIVDGTLLGILWTGSVTQAFAEVLAVALLYVVFDLVRTDRSLPGMPRSRAVTAANWLLFVVVSFVVSGAKATFVPVLGAGALVALVAAFRQRLRWRSVLAIGIVLAAELVFAQVVLFGGASQGLTFEPRTSMARIAERAGMTGLGAGALALVGVFLVVGWLVPLTAAAACGIRDQRTDRGTDLASWWLLGLVVSSMVIVLVTDHPGFSQYAFLRAGLPFAYLGVASGLVRLWERATPAWRRAGLVAIPLGAGACLLVRHWSESSTRPRGAADLALAVVATLALVVLVAGLVAIAARPGVRPVVVLLVAGMFALGMGTVRTVDAVSSFGDPRPGAADKGPAVIPGGGIEAARYVRANSGPDDLFATNAHCRLPSGMCQNIAHWMSAWTERRAVVEGWGYTPRANASGDTIGAVIESPFWDPALLALNDAVFLRPSKASLDALLARFPVHWLIVDRRFPADVPGLLHLLPRHRRFGQTFVFEVSPSR